MKQNKLLALYFKACIDNNLSEIVKLRQAEFTKIIKRRNENKNVIGEKWSKFR